MLTLWVSHLKDKASRDQFTRTVLGSKIVLDKAVEILYNIVKNENQVPDKDFDSPSWPFKQAYRLGYQAGLDRAIQLLTISDKE